MFIYKKGTIQFLPNLSSRSQRIPSTLPCSDLENTLGTRRSDYSNLVYNAIKSIISSALTSVSGLNLSAPSFYTIKLILLHWTELLVKEQALGKPRRQFFSR